MGMMLSVEKPGSPAEVLEHTGVKGMKWGVRRTPPSGSRSAVSSRFNKRNPSSADKANAIRLARAKSNLKFEKAVALKGSTQTRASRKAARKEAKLAYKKDPDRAVALRFTRGEKVVTGLLLATGIATVPIAAVVAGGYGYRRHVEKKQARGGYK
jgi:hypothetical protein